MIPKDLEIAIKNLKHPESYLKQSKKAMIKELAQLICQNISYNKWRNLWKRKSLNLQFLDILLVATYGWTALTLLPESS